MSKSLKAIAEALLCRSLVLEDGLAPEALAQTELRLGGPIPEALREFYMLLGNVPLFTSSFQRFAMLEQLDWDGDLLVFLEENQNVCYWGTDRENRVIIRDDHGDCYDSGLCLDTFLPLILHYQAAQGSSLTYDVSLPPENLMSLLEKDHWLKAVDHEGLVIFRHDGYLIWYFKDRNGNIADDMVLFSSTLDPSPAIKDKYGLREIGVTMSASNQT